MSAQTPESLVAAEFPAARFSLLVAAWNWGLPLAIAAIAALSDPLVRGLLATFLLFPLLCAGVPIAGLIGIYYGRKGVSGGHRRASIWGIALNAAAVVAAVLLVLYARNRWG